MLNRLTLNDNPISIFNDALNAADDHIMRASNSLVNTLRSTRQNLNGVALDETLVENAINRAGGHAMSVFTRTMLKMDVVQHAPLPPGPKLFAPNHPTTTDPFFLLAYVNEPLTILITEMVFRVPVFGEFLAAAGHIRVDIDNGRPAFDKAIETLKSGRSVGIFPEGALSPRDGGLCRARTGAVRLALHAGVSIVPIGVTLDRERIKYVDTTVDHLSKEARWYPKGPYAVTIGRPLTLTGSVEDRDYVRNVSGDIMRRIGRLTSESASRMQERGVPFNAIAGLAAV